MDDNDLEMRAELSNDARRIAMARAVDSLTGMVFGDQILWENGISEKYRREMRDFEDVAGNDETADQSPEGIRKLEERKKTTVTRTMVSDTTQSIRRGVLPPGITPKTFRDKDNVWYYAVAVYNPVISQAAADLADEMKNATLVQPIRKPQRLPQGKDGAAVDSDVPRPSEDIQMIPTGSFDDDDEEE